MKEQVDPMTFDWPKKMPDGWVEWHAPYARKTQAGSHHTESLGSNGFALWSLPCGSPSDLVFVSCCSEEVTGYQQFLYNAERDYYLAKREEAKQ